jgi:hypothetical protein
MCDNDICTIVRWFALELKPEKSTKKFIMAAVMTVLFYRVSVLHARTGGLVRKEKVIIIFSFPKTL